MTVRWSLVVGLGAVIVVGFGTILYGFSVYVTDAAAGAEFSTSLLSVAYAGGIIAGGILAPAVGRWSDRHGARLVIAVGASATGLGLAWFSRADRPWQLLLAWWLLIGPSTAAVYYDPAFVVLNQWIPPDRRPRAFGVLTLLGGLSGAIFIPLADRMVEAWGWRTAVLGLAMMVTAVGHLVAWTVVPHGVPGGSHVAVRRIPWSVLVADRRFAFFSGALVLVHIGATGLIAHRIDRFAEAGFALVVVSAWAGAASLISLPGRILAPLLAERWGGTLVFAGIGVALAVAAAVAVPGAGPAAGPAALVAHFVIFGLAFGAMPPVRALVMSGWYDASRYGAVTGAQTLLMLVTGAAGPLLVGVARDASGDYRAGMTLLAAGLVLGAVLSVRAGRAPVPAQAG